MHLTKVKLTKIFYLYLTKNFTHGWAPKIVNFKGLITFLKPFELLKRFHKWAYTNSAFFTAFGKKVCHDFL